ncbi:MAG: DUF1801 domain-containing protein [Bacteroidota bacterium]
MAELEIIQQTGVAAKFEAYPDEIRPKLWRLRQLIIDTASEIEGINRLEESLKWGEPSYQCRKGSPIRMDWKERAPEQYAIYFNCSTSLVETFRWVHGDRFRYEKNRAIVFGVEEEIPLAELKACIAMALQYHRLKHLPYLGA